MTAMTIQLTGLNTLKKALEKNKRESEKALETAIKVEGFFLLKQFRQEIRESKPGGRQFKGLSYLARSKGAKNLKADKPLVRLATAARYQIKRNPFQMAFGWIGPQVSASWKRIAVLQQEGFVAKMSEKTESYFRKKGAQLSKRSAAKRYLYLYKGTESFHVPARPIIEPFWRAHKAKALKNIERNFYLKLSGKRI